VSANDRAKTYAWVSDFGVGLGLAGVAVGAILMFWPDAPATSTAVRVVPAVGPSTASMTLSGAW
jgi:hypothetical protein